MLMKLSPRKIISGSERNDSNGRTATGKGHFVHHGEDPSDGSVTAASYNESLIV